MSEENNVHGMSSDELLDDMEAYFDDGFNQFIHDTYEHPKDNDRWTGRVTNNVDPLMLGRVQIMIYGKYDDIPILGLPWAIPDIKYYGSSYGNMIVPEIGTNLRGYFDHGDIHKPIYDSLAFDYNNQLSVSTAAQRKLGYPFNMVLLETNYGDYVTMNRLTAETKVQLHTGALISISPKGDISIQTGPAGSMSIKSFVSTTIDTVGNTNIKSKGVVNVDGAMVNLGKSKTKRLVNNIPVCPLTGLPHFVGNTNVLV